jgi:hypothetical protein
MPDETVVRLIIQGIKTKTRNGEGCVGVASRLRVFALGGGEGLVPMGHLFIGSLGFE